MSDDWDTGAEFESAAQDKYNKSRFDVGESHGAPEVVKGTTPSMSPSNYEFSSSSKSKRSSARRKSSSSSHKSSSSKKSSKKSSSRRKSSSAEAAPVEPPTAPMASLKIKTKKPPLPSGTSQAFTAQLDAESLEFFNQVSYMPFSEQAIQFLNAYWNEVGDQSEFIFTMAWETMKYADMHTKGVNYIHLYDEGNNVDFNVGLYFYEKLCKRVLEDPEGKRWRDDPKYAVSMPSMMTAITRKKELRDKVDVNFDGRISFLEYLLYQYRDYANPAEFTQRAMKAMDVEEHPEIRKARLALDEVNNAIREYEKEKQRLEDESKLPGVKGLSAKHQLSILNASPLAERLNTALIKAEAAVRIATKKFANGAIVAGGDGAATRPTEGSIWWMNRDLEAKKKLYGKKKK